MTSLLYAFILSLPLAAPLDAAEERARAEAAAPAAQPEAGVRELSAVNIEFRGTNIWVPATFIVKKGEKVRLTLINNAPSGEHGWAVDEFGITATVGNNERDNKKVVEFTPAKAGLFRSYCPLHPAHIGGQILVLE